MHDGGKNYMVVSGGPGVHPFRSRLQGDFVCCHCGVRLFAGSVSVVAIIGILVKIHRCKSPMSSATTIAWCDDCWDERFPDVIPRDMSA